MNSCEDRIRVVELCIKLGLCPAWDQPVGFPSPECSYDALASGSGFATS